jgi:hypothetical protein
MAIRKSAPRAMETAERISGSKAMPQDSNLASVLVELEVRQALDPSVGRTSSSGH